MVGGFLIYNGILFCWKASSSEDNIVERKMSPVDVLLR